MTANDLNIYLLPGMGANERLYEKMNIHVGHVYPLRWPPHEDAKNLKEYAEVIARSIVTKNNVIIGSSMGGMVAVELSHIIRPLSTILLSAPQGRNEFPPLLKITDAIGLHRILSANQLMKLSKAADLFMGFRDKEHRALFYEMLNTNGKEFIHFSVNAVLGWKGPTGPFGEFIQIIGDKDKLFKEKRMKSPIMLKGSGHFTTFEKAEELSELINNYLLERIGYWNETKS